MTQSQPESARLEHVNLTVSDPEATAARLCRLFGWQIRWQGSAQHAGRTIHVGSADQYVALYSGRPDMRLEAQGDTARRIGGLNHVAVTVADLDAMEARVRAEGLTPVNHADYEPGRRFYFHDPDWIEYEVVSYL